MRDYPQCFYVLHDKVTNVHIDRQWHCLSKAYKDAQHGLVVNVINYEQRTHLSYYIWYV